MPNSLSELAHMLAERDGISYEEEVAAIREVMFELNEAFLKGDYNLAETILLEDLGIEPDYLDLFIL